MKLFRVEITTDVYVTADDDIAAHLYTARNIHKILRDSSYDFDAGSIEEIKHVSGVPCEWRDGIAYGNNPGELTCAQILTPMLPSAPSERDDGK